MALEYESLPPPKTVIAHDHLYTALLGVLAFMLLILINEARWGMRMPTTQQSGTNSVRMVVFVEGGCFIGAMLCVLLVRLFLPKYRRWPTFGLNIFLLLMVPLGTMLAIYGFWKVDKKLP